MRNLKCKGLLSKQIQHESCTKNRSCCPLLVMQKCKIIIINGNLLPEKNNSNKQTKKTNM